jgi:hypothetical protein
MFRTLAIAAAIALAGCAGAAKPGTTPAPPTPRGDYLGEIAGAAPRLFAPGVVSRRYQELNAAFSPSGDELVFTITELPRAAHTLVHMVRRPSGEWSTPEVLPFSGRYPDADPMFTADGARLYFISKRPAAAGDTAERKDFDIWYADKRGASWADPVHLPAPINTDKDELYVSLTRSGSIYFARNNDIQRAVPSGGGFTVEALGAAVNGATTDEFDPFVAPDESYLIFSSGGRPDTVGGGDLYVSFRAGDDWQPARSLGPAINSPLLEYCPSVSPDGKYLFFTSYKRASTAPRERPRTIDDLTRNFDDIDNGLGNIYWLKADFLEAMRQGGPPP